MPVKWHGQIRWPFLLIAALSFSAPLRCMVSCGDPSSPAAHVGDANPHRAHAPESLLDQCGNMRLQQRRHKKILLGPSEVAGWGAFVCGGAQAGELLGEYTGELVTDQEAEQRGRVYDANNKSFLFQLNDQVTHAAPRTVLSPRSRWLPAETSLQAAPADPCGTARAWLGGKPSCHCRILWCRAPKLRLIKPCL